MPEVSRFYGIRIVMYPNDHHPPHFHALYAGDDAIVEINPIRVRSTNLPKRALSLVLEWAALHQEELWDHWNRVRAGQEASRIPPLP